MTDVFDKSKRSDIMQKIRGKGNRSTELALINLFKKQKITGWRRGYPVKGHPDVVFLNEKIAIFVDGCFWHGHDCRNTRPKSNEEFWSNKIDGNIEHDKIVTEKFEKRGWTVVRIWECELKKINQEKLIAKLNVLLSKICGKNDIYINSD